MKIRFLGTGTSQGIPIIGSNHPVCMSTDSKDKRLRVSVLVQIQGKNIVIDCGPDFRQQMLSANCTFIDALLFTHEHADHTAGLDDIRPYCHRQGKLPIYLQDRVLKSLQRRFDYIFETENRYPGAPEVAPTVVDNEVFFVGDLKIIPIQVHHGKLDILGYRIKDFVYITDAKVIDDNQLEKLKQVEVLVVNALRIEKHDLHFSLQEALDFIYKVKPKRAYLTHISPMLGFHEQVQADLPENVFLAYDNLEIEI